MELTCGMTHAYDAPTDLARPMPNAPYIIARVSWLQGWEKKRKNKQTTLKVSELSFETHQQLSTLQYDQSPRLDQLRWNAKEVHRIKPWCEMQIFLMGKDLLLIYLFLSQFEGSVIGALFVRASPFCPFADVKPANETESYPSKNGVYSTQLYWSPPTI